MCQFPSQTRCHVIKLDIFTHPTFQDYIVEKVKKLGGFTTFNMFIMKELETMYKLLTEIKTTLTVSVWSNQYNRKRLYWSKLTKYLCVKIAIVFLSFL